MTTLPNAPRDKASVDAQSIAKPIVISFTQAHSRQCIERVVTLEEWAFLETIAAGEAGETSALLYADWLENQSDPERQRVGQILTYLLTECRENNPNVSTIYDMQQRGASYSREEVGQMVYGLAFSKETLRGCRRTHLLFPTWGGELTGLLEAEANEPYLHPELQKGRPKACIDSLRYPALVCRWHLLRRGMLPYSDANYRVQIEIVRESGEVHADLRTALTGVLLQPGVDVFPEQVNCEAMPPGTLSEDVVPTIATTSECWSESGARYWLERRILVALGHRNSRDRGATTERLPDSMVVHPTA